MTQFEERAAELEGKIQQARYDYYNDMPSVPDATFDAWVDELAELMADSPAVTAIGAPPASAWAKVTHAIPMGSLDKVQTPDEMTTWIQRVSREPQEGLVVTEKLDGISISLRYVSGKLVQALTRGDGLTGEDITSNVLRMKGILRELPTPVTMFCRGEIVLPKADHQKHFPSTSNPRNTASGTAKRLDGQGCEHLTVLVYQALEVEGVDLRQETDALQFLGGLGFQTPRWYRSAGPAGEPSPHDLWVTYQQSLRESLPYEIDGLVVRLDDLAYQWSLGDKHGRPVGAVAFKFSPIARETLVTGRVDQVGGTGRITPVAVFKPIHILGAEITRASLYNQRYVEQIGFDVGAKVLVTRANDVIPRVVAVTQSTGRVSAPPACCPECGASTERDGEYIVCPNTGGCPAQTEGRIKTWVEKQGILEWGPSLIQRVVAEGLVKSVPDLYRLKHEQLQALERMGEASAKNALDELWKVNPITMDMLTGSLGIPLCGRSTMQTVVDAGYDTLDKLRAADAASLMQIPGMGPQRAQALRKWLDSHGDVLTELLEVGIKLKVKAAGVLSGKSVCFTGKSNLKRADLEGLVEAAGGVVKNSVGKGLTYLVMAEPGSASTKAQAAKKNGTTCISEEAFVKLAQGDA